MTDKFDVLIFIKQLLAEQGRVTWSDLFRYFVEKAPPWRRISKRSLHLWLIELIRDGLVEKKIDEKTLRPCYIVTTKGEDEVTRQTLLKKTYLRKWRGLSPLEVFLTKEITGYFKRLNQINRQFESYRVLPLTTVLKKLCAMGFELKDFYDEPYLLNSHFKFEKEKTSGSLLPPPEKLTNFFQGIIKFEDTVKADYEISPDEIEILLLPEEEITKGMSLHYYWGKERKLQVQEEIKRNGLGWLILTKAPIKGYHILGAYKKFLNIYLEYFEKEWLRWKKEFSVLDQDWERIGPYVAFLMMDNWGEPLSQHIKISSFIYFYYQSAKPNFLNEMEKDYIEDGLDKQKAARLVKNIAKFYEKYRKSQPEEIWANIEKLISKVFTRARIFQYLKVKYCPSAKPTNH